VDRKRVYEGHIISVEHNRYRFADGEEAERDIVRHPGAVGIVCVDDEHVWLVRQPRQAVDDPDVLEIPAGKLDEQGESPLDTAKRELAEEIGKGAEHWESLRSFWTSVGILDEEVHLYLATGLRDEHAETDENERIEVVRWPLDRLAELLDTVKDSKTRIGLLELHRRRANG
jgi:ADP-ribose pyrophosphatase